MPWFHYKAVSASGEVLEGELEASDRQAVVEELRRLGHVPIRAEARRGRGVAGRRVRVSGRGRVSGRQVAFLTQELAILLAHGILHLLGYDHMEPDDEAVMKAEEVRVLSGVPQNE